MVIDFARIVLFALAMILAVGYSQNFHEEDEPFLRKVYLFIMTLLFVGAGAITILWV